MTVAASTGSATTNTTANNNNPARRNNPAATVVDLSRPTFASSPFVNANPGSEALLKLAATIPELRALLVLEHGQVVATYTRSDIDPVVPYRVISTTKSWLSLIMGRMIQDGQLRLDETLGEIFDDHETWLWKKNDNSDDDEDDEKNKSNHQEIMEEDLKFRRAITIKDLLTMTSGLQLPATTTDADGNEKWNDGGGTLTDAILEPPRIIIENNNSNHQDQDQAKPFHYLGASNIMSYICKQRTDYASPREYLATKVFPSLGISNAAIEWRQNKEGMELSYYGLAMTPTHMAKLGQLYLQGGRCNSNVSANNILIDEDWVTESTSLQAGNTDYGYLWWVYPTMFCAKGLGGQDICISPTTDRVVVQQRDFNFAKGQFEATTATGLATLALAPDLEFFNSNSESDSNLR